DRLCIGPDSIQVVDFKTGGRFPETAEGVPVPHLRQMAAYVAALEAIFPGRTVEAALLYTAGPALIGLPPAVLTPHKPGFSPEQHNL
ncbi:PD-(D/E)XK nuclease family protein, partial [Sphingobium phenoxybenzoativorans]